MADAFYRWVLSRIGEAHGFIGFSWDYSVGKEYTASKLVRWNTECDMISSLVVSCEGTAEVQVGRSGS